MEKTNKNTIGKSTIPNCENCKMPKFSNHKCNNKTLLDQLDKEIYNLNADITVKTLIHKKPLNEKDLSDIQTLIGRWIKIVRKLKGE